MARKISWISLFRKVIDFLIKECLLYVIIGGVAADVWGRPRKTLDLDLVLRLGPEQYEEFLNRARCYKLSFVRSKALQQLRKMGMCRLRYESYHVDFIMGYSDFERVIFERKRQVKIFGRQVWLASPEDIILYKLLSAREIDLADIHNIIEAQRMKLDKSYLRERAKLMQKELFRTDIMQNLKRSLTGG